MLAFCTFLRWQTPFHRMKMQTMPNADPYRPPRPKPLTPIAALIRVVMSGDGNLLGLVPAEAYRKPAGYLGYSRRSILIVNDPDLTRGIMTDPTDIYPKNDLMVGALEPLVGDSIFVSSGDRWRRQRRMIDPAFSHMRLTRAFTSMSAAVNAYEEHLKESALKGLPFSLDLAMGHLTADIITRTVFSTSLESETAKEVFEAFSEFERSVAHVELKRLIFDPPFKAIPQHDHVLDACKRIRHHLGALVDRHLAPATNGATCPFDDIASAVIAAEDSESGARFSREELIDQLGVFFLAGHETTASALTWAFFIMATRPEVMARVREEVDCVVGDGPVTFEHTKQLTYIRNLFKETLRLYPPITFIPRVAAEPVQIGKHRVKKGAMIMIAPWVIHRHLDYWDDPDRFDPDRFSPEREKTIRPGTYMPFGLGPRVCVGAGFAGVESALIIAQLVRRFDFTVEDADRVRPVARLTTRPAEQIMCRARLRQA
jgi:cytochrome P450